MYFTNVKLCDGDMATIVHRLLDGTVLRVTDLDRHDVRFLKTLRAMVKDEASYFDILRFGLSPGSPAMRGRGCVDRELAEMPFFKAVTDIVTRAGIDQGLLLAPEHRNAPVPQDLKEPMNVITAANVIGVSRAAVYQALDAGRLPFVRIGNVRVIERRAAEAYKRRREARRRKAAP